MINTTAYDYLTRGLFLGFMFGQMYTSFEGTSHRRHLSKWNVHRRTGKLYSIVSYYTLGRAIPILFVLLIIPLAFNLRPGTGSIQLFVITAMVLLSVVAIGFHEWWKCEEEFSIQSMKDAAEQIESSHSKDADGGV